MKSVIQALILVALLGSSAASQSTVFPQEMDKYVLDGTNLILLQQYSRADSVFRELAALYPSHPIGYLQQAGVIQARAMDYNEVPDRERLDSLLSIAKRYAEELIDSERDSPWGYYFLATAQGYESYARIYSGEYISGFLSARSSVSNFEDALARSPQLADAYPGIGMYYYWKSRRMKFLAWTPFIQDQRTEGITLLEKAVQQARYGKYTAALALISIYNDADRHQEARALAEEVLKTYPSNRLFLWGLVRALRDGGDTTAALSTYYRLLAECEKNGDRNLYHSAVCRINIGRILQAKGDTKKAIEMVKPVAKINPERFPAHLQKRFSRQLTAAREILASAKP